jgi:hypothetical protein
VEEKPIQPKHAPMLPQLDDLPYDPNPFAQSPPKEAAQPLMLPPLGSPSNSKPQKILKGILTPKNKTKILRKIEKDDHLPSVFDSSSDLDRTNENASPKNFRINSRPNIIIDKTAKEDPSQPRYARTELGDNEESSHSRSKPISSSSNKMIAQSQLKQARGRSEGPTLLPLSDKSPQPVDKQTAKVSSSPVQVILPQSPITGRSKRERAMGYLQSLPNSIGGVQSFTRLMLPPPQDITDLLIDTSLTSTFVQLCSSLRSVHPNSSIDTIIPRDIWTEQPQPSGVISLYLPLAEVFASSEWQKQHLPRRGKELVESIQSKLGGFS